jgi:Flp pilus assembly protein TadG
MNGLRRFFGRGDQEGQAVVLFAIVMLTLLFFVGLAIDAGQLYSNKRTQQEAADSAAFAGAVVIYQGGTDATGNLIATPSQITAAARADALKNGYANTPAGCTSIDVDCTTEVRINYPPLSGAYIGNDRHIEVNITRKVQTSLVPAEAALNPVRARGVAGADRMNNGYAIMALDPGPTQRAFYADNQADVHLTGGGILVNSTDGSAADNQQNNASRFTVQSPYGLDVVGGATGFWTADGIPVNNHAPVQDPFFGTPTPATSGPHWCSYGLPNCAAPVYTSIPNGPTVTLNEGIYKVKIQGSGNQTFNLTPGWYILEAGMDTSGNGVVDANGVFVFNTYNTYPASPGASPTCGDMSLSGNGALTFTAMTVPPYANLLFYQDPNCINPFQISGNGTFTSTGSVYLPNAAFTFDGNNATLNGSQLVAKTVFVQSGNITINYNPGITFQPILPRLDE